MKFPFFATTALLSIFCAMLLLKSFDYGHAWAVVLAAVGFLLFAILTIIALQYQMRQHEGQHHEEEHHH